MRVATSLTLPDELERARSAGELVVFVGAGVSMGAPANLPDFVELAREIAGTMVAMGPSDETALDRYLGRAERSAGVKVQERARVILRERRGSHTPLHEHLIGLFNGADSVRLVTTNFDTHFSAAATQVWGAGRIRRYVGPALPPGRAFRGIVQLHGSLDNQDDRLVLTDRDFGAAYMTESWAARFLVGVFADRTIVFVGYRLGDPVMQYLMRALPPTNRWYALCHEDDGDRWRDHDVVPVTFGTRENNDRYGDLNDGLQRWRWYATAPPSDHDGELRRLLALGPPLAPVDDDYVRARLKGDAGCVTFWSAATDVAWFGWAVAEGLLHPLLDATANHALVERWGRWVLQHFCLADQPALLRFLRDQSLHIHPQFALEIARHLTFANPLPPSDVVRQLVALLVNQPHRVSERVDHYKWLLDRLIREGHPRESLALFRWMTRVHLEPIERFRRMAEAIGDEPAELPPLTNRIGINGPPGELIRLLDERGATLAAALGTDLLELGEQRMEEAYQLLDLARGSGPAGIDWLSFGRTAIARSDQDEFGAAEDVLVLLVRVVLDHWREHSPEHLLVFAERHAGSKRILLRRLGLYALGECPLASPEAVLDQATTDGWAREFQLRPELYRLLATHYGAASEDAKARFVTALRDDAWWGGTIDEHQQHARFSLSQLLLRLSPSNDTTRSFAAAESAIHPTWGEGDRDGFLMRTESHWAGEELSPIPSEQLLRWPAQDALREITSKFQPGPESEERNVALLGAVQQAVKTDGHWGVELLVAAAAASDALSAVPDAILWALRDSSCSLEDRLATLTFASTWDWPITVTRPLASLFEKWAGDDLTSSDVTLLDALDSAADRIYARARDIESSLLGEASWAERAINHPAGIAGLIWLKVANARDRVGGAFVLSIDDAERERWEDVIADAMAGGGFARAVLGMATERLGQGDYPWAARVVFPAFDPNAGHERAAQLWDGRLMQRTWSRAIVAGLMPALPAFFAVSATLVPARARELGDWVALLVTRWTENGLSLALLQRFVQNAAPQARQAFADGLPNHLKDLAPDVRRRLWVALLQAYWRDRRTNVPIALEDAEAAGMVEWVVALPEVASEVLAELDRTEGEAIPHADRVIWAWRQDDAWIRAHPGESAHLVRWLAVRRSIPQWVADSAVAHLETALAAGAPRQEVLLAAEAMGALQCQQAIVLARRLRDADPPQAA